ncbi:MAG: VOC family protein [Acidimicrobiia bacterium]|nr:VOC family protein [Acidimicrobiia bacterium]
MKPTISLGYTIFYVDDVEETVTFFTTAFGLERRFVTPENDYGEVDTGATTLAFVSIELAKTNLDTAGGFSPPDPARPAPVSITLLTSEVAETVEDAVAAGARRYVAPTEKPWGQTVAYVLGPSNVLIELATPVQTQ